MAEAKRKLFGFFGSKKKADPKEEELRRDEDHSRERSRRRGASRRRREVEGRERQRSKYDLNPPPPIPGKEASPATSTRHIAPDSLLPPPLTSWPPPGFSNDAELTQSQGLEHILPGAPIFRGIQRSVPHASSEYYNLYASCTENGNSGTDVGDVFTSAFEVDSLSLRYKKAARHPWETLEQPSMAFCYGARPGEITFNHWISLSGVPSPNIELRDPGVKPRDVELVTILKRLKYLEGGFEEDYEDLRYKNLYNDFLRDPDKHKAPHKSMEKQIADLILVLSSQRWTDFSLPQNQVVAKFFSGMKLDDRGEGKLFFHQLVLGTELFLRLYSKHYDDEERDELVRQLPPRISWTIALARKWRECIKLEPFEEKSKERVRFRLRNKRAQVKALRKFARVMKWPNLLSVDNLLKEETHSRPLEEKSSDAMSYFSGLVLPGATLPWLIMNTLIDCDVDAGVNALAALTHMHPNTGFQYRSTTYWAATSIIGKVLAPTCRSVAGWVGPARPAPDLSRIAIARIRQRSLKDIISPTDILDMHERSDPLGPGAKWYPVKEYTLPMPEFDPEYLTNNIRIEKLGLKPVTTTSSSSSRDKPILYDASLQFAVAGESWPLKLAYNVSFISACPCARGPHPLFFDYTYQTVKIEDLLSIRSWGSARPHNNTTSTLPSIPSPPDSHISPPLASSQPYHRPNSPPNSGLSREDEEGSEDKVLVVEAFGVSDNEVLARAWCAHWALSAVVADMEKTCLACAVREAYAGCLKVVIVVEALDGGDEGA